MGRNEVNVFTLMFLFVFKCSLSFFFFFQFQIEVDKEIAKEEFESGRVFIKDSSNV